jgi:hypothetical protein
MIQDVTRGCQRRLSKENIPIRKVKLCMCEGQPVNGSQTYMKRKTCDIRTWKYIYFSTYTQPTLIHCPIALPVRRSPQHRSLLAIVSATSAPPFQPLRHQRNVFHSVVNCFTRLTLPNIKKKYFFMNILCIESFCAQKET